MIDYNRLWLFLFSVAFLYLQMLNYAADEFSHDSLQPPLVGVTTPLRDSPADLETLQQCSDRPVCLPGHIPLPVILLTYRGGPRNGWHTADLRASMNFPH